MKSIPALFALLVLALSQPLLAHTQAASSTPADGAEVSAPTEIRLAFPAAVRLTAVILSDEAGDEIEMASIPAEPGKEFAVAIKETLAPGRYLVMWRSVSGDSHIVSGEIRFTVTG
jgi:methionine-rich copper-binding protein CopC